MVTPVSISQTTPKIVNTSIFYVNDEHSDINNMERLKTASDSFDSFVPSKKTDKLKFAEGDFALGKNKNLNQLAVTAQNVIGFMATAGGNHEFDLNKKDLADVLKNNDYKLLGANVEIPQDSAENKALHDEVTKSYIQEVNGTKYGVIGLLPFDFHAHVSDDKEYKDFEISSLEKTIPVMQKEIDEMQKQGVNKIIVLSHAGYDQDIQIAQKVEGIDVILGGHTHNLIEGIQEGKNLFYSTKTGAPTIITQAGKNGDHYGILNLQFDENGLITMAQNNVKETADSPKSLIMEFFINKILGQPKVLGMVNSAPKEKISLVKENATSDFITDALREQLDVDIAFLNAGGIRSCIQSGKLTDRDIKGLTPFENKLCIAKLNEKEIVDAIKIGANSINDINHQPGILQVSGLKYTMTKTGEVKQINYVDKNGKETTIDINNPDINKTYRVVMDNYIGVGRNGYFAPDKWDTAEQRFDFDNVKPVSEYVAKQNKPIDVNSDGRIQIVD